jgi:hypothetical protein
VSTKLKLKCGADIEDVAESKWCCTGLHTHVKPNPNDGLYMNIFTAKKLKLN